MTCPADACRPFAHGRRREPRPLAPCRSAASLAASLRVALARFLGVLTLGASAQATTSLSVGGAVTEPLTLSVDDLKRLPTRRIDEARGEDASGKRLETVRRHMGVLLRDVLDRAGLVEAQRHDLRRSVVLATASDGYRVVFSWAELYLSPIGDGVLVAFERDGLPLDDREGRIALLSLKDARPGPRHVRWLQRLDVVRVGS